ncbi:hypothetical protein IC229_32345 [Spirosoma sp. BT702]|uniref:Uncharacterized protein n=1 Tax=Spirosoma profusum TaxID=2771354 RepID=A0A927GA84_9BACT|nr:hypothetical protein [Spirosoma profusum]MBD2705351.1 hypothetical protein [Spirosoma profusum]
MERSYKHVSYLFVAILAIIVAGFYKSYFSKFPVFTGFTYVHHTHSLLLLLWFVMLIIQPILIYQKRLDLHRLIGKASYVLVPLIVWSMLAVMRKQYLRNLPNMPEVRNLASLYLPVSALIPFVTLYVLAIIYCKKPALHMRYMIASAIALLGPGIGRINFGFADFKTAVMFAFALGDVFLVGLLIYEFTKGKNYRPYLISLLICAVFHYAFPWAPNSAGWEWVAQGLVRLFSIATL